ncbi:conserved hypothetical protein [Ricinus communis]|uniref:Uncharacterized protein n=1 Tax=Ricinus communis TaxID=3988 RepID=B9SZJ4_RICCO|nr:conserved hypothetical protein [Ricinus communis]
MAWWSLCVRKMMVRMQPMAMIKDKRKRSQRFGLGSMKNRGFWGGSPANRGEWRKLSSLFEGSPPPCTVVGWRGMEMEMEMV